MKILSGTVSWHNQNWQNATASFLKASTSEDETLRAYAEYGLALSYASQNEMPSAEERYAKLTDSGDDRLRSAAWYQKGICAYRNEDYQQAAACFRSALEIEPSRTDAKINLELSLLNDKNSRQDETDNAARSSAARASGVTENAVLSLIRSQEEMRWKKAAQEEELPSVPDY